MGPISRELRPEVEKLIARRPRRSQPEMNAQRSRPHPRDSRVRSRDSRTRSRGRGSRQESRSVAPIGITVTKAVRANSSDLEKFSNLPSPATIDNTPRRMSRGDRQCTDFSAYVSPKPAPVSKAPSRNTIDLEIELPAKKSDVPPLHARGLTDEFNNAGKPHRKSDGTQRTRRLNKFPSLDNVPSLPSEKPFVMKNDPSKSSRSKKGKKKQWTTIEWVGLGLMIVSILGLIILGICMIAAPGSDKKNQDEGTNAVQNQNNAPANNQQRRLVEWNGKAEDCCTSCSNRLYGWSCA